VIALDRRKMKLLQWMLPTGTILTIGGVLLCAQAERHGFETTLDWEYAVLSATFAPSLLLGAALAIAGSVLDRSRLPLAQTRVRGALCWGVSVISLALFLTRTESIHGWTVMFLAPTFVGFVAGCILLSKWSESI
jgi:peptidoglycan/LPS O-acetylase OafA/YrhL